MPMVDSADVRQRGNPSNSYETQRMLASFYARAFAGPYNHCEIPDSLPELAEIRDVEDLWNRYEEARIGDESLPASAAAFPDWYRGIFDRHAADVRPFFDHLAESAKAEELAFYICLEEMVDGHFDDVIALSQIGMRGRGKIIMAENYWDEMGRGNAKDVHTTMFAESADHMKRLLVACGIDMPKVEPVEGLKNGNLLSMWALRRHYILRLLGAIGILEHTASARFAATVTGLRRLGFSEEVIRYHEAHIEFDANHGAEWLDHVLLPLIAESKVAIREICLGILIRYRIAVEYYQAIQSRTADMVRGHSGPALSN